MLKWNATRVRRLTGTEIWMFIVARVLIGFGLGALAVHYFPAVASTLGVPALGLGALLFAIASIGLFRQSSADKSAGDVGGSSHPR
jgi:uncharacterized protein involved in response to NO